MLPGGKANKNESRELAAKRELEEETGLKAIKAEYLFKHKGSSHKSYKGGEFINLDKVFLVNVEGEQKADGHEVKYIAFYKPESDIVLTRDTKLIIDKFIEHKQKISYRLKRWIVKKLSSSAS